MGENGVRNYVGDGKNTWGLIGFKLESQGSIAIYCLPLTYEFEIFSTHLHLCISTKNKILITYRCW